MILKPDKNDLKTGPDFKFHLKTGPVFKCHLKFGHVCPVFKCLNHLKSGQIFVRYSDESDIQALGIQAVTVFIILVSP